MDATKFTVIMPCYNSAAYVRDAVDSIIRQTYPEWELIVVNDGSKDETLDILNEYAALDARIRVFSKENGGYISAVTEGMKYISGDYFMFMGSDDSLCEELFERLTENMTDRTPDIICFRTLQYQGKQFLRNDPESFFETSFFEENVSFREFLKAHPKHGRILVCRDTSKCFRTTLADPTLYFGRYGYDADGIFSMLTAHKARSFLAVPVDGYRWTLRNDSVSGRVPSPEVNRDRLMNWEKFYQLLSAMPIDERTEHEKRIFSDYVLSVLWQYCQQVSNEKDHDLKAFCRSFLRIAKKLGWDQTIPTKKKLLLQFPTFFRILAHRIHK